MRKLKALKVRGFQRKKKVFYKLENLFFFLLFFITSFHLHFKDDFKA